MTSSVHKSQERTIVIFLSILFVTPVWPLVEALHRCFQRAFLPESNLNCPAHHALWMTNLQLAFDCSKRFRHLKLFWCQVVPRLGSIQPSQQCCISICPPCSWNSTICLVQRGNQDKISHHSSRNKTPRNGERPKRAPFCDISPRRAFLRSRNFPLESGGWRSVNTPKFCCSEKLWSICS